MRKILLTLFAIAMILLVKAQTLDECCSMARDKYPAMAKYGLIEKTEEYSVENAVRAWIPQINFMAQASWQTATPTFPEELQNITGMDMSMRKDQYKIAIDLHQNIWDGGVASANKNIAKADAEVNRHATDAELDRVEERVENIYFGILLLEEKDKQMELAMELLAKNLSRVKALTAGGVAKESDADLIEVELLTAGQQLDQVRASKESYRKMLEIFIGQQLENDSLEKPLSAEIKSRESARSELKLFDSQIESLTARQKLAKTEVMPKFGLFAQGYYGYPGLDMFKSMTSDELTFNAIVGVRMTWRIGSLYTYKNKHNNIELAKNQVEIERDVFDYNTRMATTQEDGNIVRLKKAVEDDDRIVELRKNVREFAESQFENGLTDMTDLLRKITDETNALLNKSIHEVELLQAQYRLKRILNQ